MRVFLIILYMSFCVIATCANLGAQRWVFSFGDSAWVFPSAIFIGTGVGLVIKYFLDKRWIFHDQAKGINAQGRQFFLYTVMGLLTTAIFWSFETAFWLIWQTDHMREVGAMTGLTIGYTTKYWLDRQYVFAT